jgi:hypothetical protein
MTLVLLAGICFGTAAAVLVLGVRRLPERPRCPQCNTKTHAVVAPRWIRWFRVNVDARWCMQCGWEGLSRRSSVARFSGAVKHLWGVPGDGDIPDAGEN